jgi:hypothetical protein
MRRRLLPLLSAFVVGLAVVGVAANGRATDKKGTPAQEVAKEQAKLNEADVLRNAYVELALANHDYAGHRAKAMHHILDAFRLVEDALKKGEGTAQQKRATLEEEVQVARARIAAKERPKIGESQAASDAQLRLAAAQLNKLAPVLAERKQKKMLEHVEKAIKEIGIALEIR